MSKSRNEKILENMLGADHELLPPMSRTEELLQQILEKGGSGGESVFIVGGVEVDVDGNISAGRTLDKTWKEIRDALQNKICIAVASFNDGFIQFPVSSAALFNGEYMVLIGNSENQVAFSTSTPSGYPVNKAS